MGLKEETSQAEGGGTLEQAAQRSCMHLVIGNVPGHVGRGFKGPSLDHRMGWVGVGDGLEVAFNDHLVQPPFKDHLVHPPGRGQGHLPHCWRCSNVRLDRALRDLIYWKITGWGWVGFGLEGTFEDHL